MSLLKKIHTGKENKALKILLYGTEGIGKSTFGAGFPSPLFISSEDGMTNLKHIERFVPEKFDDVLNIIAELSIEKTLFKTIVVDTMDWLERLIQEHVCLRDGKDNIEEYGYGKGYTIVEVELVKLLKKLEKLVEEKEITVVLLAHAQMRVFNDPQGISYDRYEMKGNKKFTGILREWPDACLFAVYDVFKAKEAKSRQEIAVGGERIINTNWNPAYDAKNRLNLPDRIKLDYEIFINAVKKNSVEEMKKEAIDLSKNSNIPEEKKASLAVFLKNINKCSPLKIKQAITLLKTYPKK